MYVRINASSGSPDDWARSAGAWEELGITHIALNTMGAGYRTPADHIAAIRRFAEVVPLPR